MKLAKEKAVSRLRVQSFSISLDGYGAGPDQDLENPLGVGGMALGYRYAEHVTTQQATHVVLKRDR